MCTPLSAGTGLNLQPNFQKWGLDRTSTGRGGIAGKEGMTFLWGVPIFTHKKIKSEIFNDKKSL